MVRSVDKVFNGMSKTQKYLGWRIVMVVLLVISALDTILKTQNISDTLFLNTLLLLFAPLFLEYLLGLNTYSGLSNTSRWAGLISTGFMLGVCFFGYFGKVSISLTEKTSLINQIYFFEIPILILIKIVAYIILGIVVFDSMFSFSKRERYYHSMQSTLEDYLEENYDELKESSSLEHRAKQFKEELTSQL